MSLAFEFGSKAWGLGPGPLGSWFKVCVIGPRLSDLGGGLGSGAWGLAWDLGPGALGLCFQM